MSKLLTIILLVVNIHAFSQVDSGLYFTYKGYNLLIEQKTKEAINAYSNALRYCDTCAYNLINMGLLYTRLRDYPTAIKYLKRAEKYTNNKENLAKIYNQFGCVYFKKEFYSVAIDYFLKSHNISPKSLRKLNISLCYLHLHNPDSAFYFFKKSIQNQSNEIVFRNTVFFAEELQEYDTSVAFKLIRKLDLVNNNRYFDKYYLLKARATRNDFFLDFALKYSNDLFVKVNILEEKKDYNLAINILDTLMISANNYSSRLEIAKRQSILYNKLILKTLTNNDNNEVFRLIEQSKSIALKVQMTEAGLIPDENVIDLEQVSKTLKHNEQILEYKLLDSLLLIFSITHKESNLYTKPVGKDFSEAINLFIKTCSMFPKTVNTHEFKEVSHKAYQYLINTIPINGKTLIIISDEYFYNLPFDALLKNTTGTCFRDLNYLIKSNPIRYLYTASMNGKVRLKKPRIKFITTTHPMPGALEMKARFIVEDNPNILHFYTHGRINTDSSLYSYLELENKRLYVKDVLEEGYNSQIVSLAACHTGQGTGVADEGGITFDRAFIATGTDIAITSFWEAEDVTTPYIFNYFYNYLSNGLRTEIAMQKAKIEFLNNISEVGYHPNVWANYAVIGKTGKAPKHNIWKLLVYALAFLAVWYFYNYYLKKKFIK